VNGYYGDESDGAWGFVFHDVCWTLLDTLYGTDDVPLARLHAVLTSLPSPVSWTGPSWCHTYGGLYKAHPGEKLWNGLLYLEGRAENKQVNSAPYNPLRITGIERPHDKRKLKGPFLLSAWEWPERVGEDPFARLPLEIIYMIVDLLPVRDVGAARGASRVLVGVFHDQYFWRTRFKARGERAWLFEAFGPTRVKKPDWRVLYRRKRGRILSRQERNRARIWSILQETRDVLSLEWSGDVPEVGVEGDDGVAGQHWLTVSKRTDDTPPAEDSGSGGDFCYRFREQVIHLPGPIKAVSASVVRLEDTTYITGMRITPAGHGAIRAGYLDPAGEQSFDVTGSNHGHVQGFNLAVGRWGIQAVQCIFFDESTSSWIGNPDDVPVSRLSAPDGIIHDLKADFDVGRDPPWRWGKAEY
ncbi:hypothetical protein IMZ48_32985, partial [Candidatus Bathyarchaeota archaeon]|nr:hypothetical protein [Candidatus Bathyarchaeota archaeon]